MATEVGNGGHREVSLERAVSIDELDELDSRPSPNGLIESGVAATGCGKWLGRIQGYARNPKSRGDRETIIGRSGVDIDRVETRCGDGAQAIGQPFAFVPANNDSRY